ncbi:cbb3-type cytochrome oxidase assembly protein CcoS [Chryseobacterium sp. 09-1422]|jgi:cbb3-type cytochrome oxidase maturation protein|uniref:Cbb3-type cytochrome oxidase assembly protein CcoS n=1 Tax=Chryseobacterium kimseyorum TaxID=2984028 RepID=A0ABT3HZS5_9FLAO|nr:cbb3-type cytochrome oxidase assembly protein CcoS [Chryseobacterium kimseyorum]MCW3169297.1 cbb3-type cytochrome oxidase assembly protein CcoS [Chryseobacterium kimseyorum]
MDILYLMILCSASLAAVFLIVFIVNARKGQFEDDESPAVRILFDDEVKEDKKVDSGNKNEREEKGENNKIEEKSE